MPEPGTVPARRVKTGATSRRPQRLEGPAAGDWEAGETDLHEALMPRGSLSMLVTGLIVLAVIAAAGLLIIPRLMAPDVTPTAAETALTRVTEVTEVAVQGTVITRLAPPPTNTRLAVQPTLDLATVTPQPPTQTLTPTRGPCIQKAKAGDTLYGLAARCGHRDKAVVDQILRINNMSSATGLQIGQEIEIPWPTPTGGAPVPADATGESTGQPDQALEPTLPPGVMWYTVKKGENALIIAFSRGIPLRILRDLNPEVPFDGCDFGQNGGGPTCTVILYEGQRLRVPAPTPTPTIQPTPNGSETPTPTATATYNAPFSQSPSDNMLFESFEFPTLRWTTTGQLKPDEVYLITVVDRTADITRYATTRDLSFQVPADWQPSDGKKHIFAWTITVSTLKGDRAIPSPYATETRTFTWQSR